MAGYESTYYLIHYVLMLQDYRLDPENALRAQWEKQSKLTIVQTTKACPKCNAPTEKSGKRTRRQCHVVSHETLNICLFCR